VTQYPREMENIVPSPKIQLDEICANCESSRIYEYPVNSEGGWFVTRRCESCLFELERRRWKLYGPIALLPEETVRFKGKGSADARS